MHREFASVGRMVFEYMVFVPGYQLSCYTKQYGYQGELPQVASRGYQQNTSLVAWLKQHHVAMETVWSIRPVSTWRLIHHIHYI